jgi:LemA protein
VPNEVWLVNTNNFIGNAGIVGIIGIVVLSLGLFSIVWATRLFNRLIKLRTLYEEGWSGVQAALKSRRDLVHNIEKAAEISIMTHEPETFRSITHACAQGQAAHSVAETARAELSMTTALAGFRTILENYPALIEDKNMMQIYEELSGLEERIERTRRYYNATARDYNMEMDQFPANLIVRLIGFKRATFFEIDEKGSS